MCAHEEENQDAGACMGADDRSDVAGDDIFYAVFFLHQIFELDGILGAVAVGNEDGVKIGSCLAQFPCQQLHGGFPAPNLGGANQVTVVVHINDWLDVHHGAHHSSGSADAAAPFQMAQIVNGDPVADIQLMFLHPVVQGIDIQAFVPFFAGIPYKQALPQSGTEGIHHMNFAVRVGSFQLLSSDDSGLIGRGQSGGDSQDKDILSVFQCLLHMDSPTVGIDGGSGSRHALAQLVIECLDGSGFGKIAVAFALIDHGQRGAGYIQLVVLLSGKVTAGIGNNLIGHD